MIDHLKSWGLYPKDYSQTFKQLGLSNKILQFLTRYIKRFPISEGIVFQGNPKIAAKVAARTVRELLEGKKFKNRITVVDVPSYLIRSFNYIEDRIEMESRLSSDLLSSDLILFQEIALSQWNNEQQARLYTLIHERYSKGLPFFCTVSCSPADFERHVGGSNFFRIADGCTFLEL